MKRVAIVVAVLLVMLCGGGYVALTVFQQNQRREAERSRAANEAVVKRQDLVSQVVDSGAIDALKSVEVKSRVSGRLARLLVEEGDAVSTGQLIAVIDPKETTLQVRQNRAQLRGALSAAERTSIEIDQRRVTARANYDRALARVRQVAKEMEAQPVLTGAGIAGAEAALRQAEEALRQLIQTTQPNERTQAESAAQEAAASLEKAESERERRRALLDRGYISAREFDDADLQLRLTRTRKQAADDRLARLEGQQRLERLQAEARVRQARSEVDRARAGRIQDDVKRREYESAMASLRDAEAGLKDVQVLGKAREQSLASVDQIATVLQDSERQLGETAIRSPIAGVVSRRLVQEGELVASLSSFSAGTTLVVIEDRRRMIVRLNMNEIDVAKLRLGMKTSVTVDALPESKLTGLVTKIAPASGAAGTTPTGDAVVRYRVEVTLNESDDRLRTGMTAKCTLEAVRRDGVLALPLEFIGRDGDTRYVQIVEGGKTRRQNVRLGLTTGANAEILEGVREGQRVRRPAFTGPRRQGFIQTGPNN
jgi:HlyD family secretion protein